MYTLEILGKFYISGRVIGKSGLKLERIISFARVCVCVKFSCGDVKVGSDVQNLGFCFNPF